MNLRQAARGRECQVRIPGVCNFDPATTILAHLNGAGMGRKASDIHASLCCSACHDVADSRVQSVYTSDEVKLMFLEGIMRTQEIWLTEGRIVITN